MVVLYEATDSFEDQLEHENSPGNDAGGQQKQFDWKVAILEKIKTF